MTGTSKISRLRLRLVVAEYLERMGQRIRSRREELGMSRSDVARAMPGKTNENAIYRWEKGLHRPEDDALEALAGVLQVGSPGWFFADDDATQRSATPNPFGGDDLASQFATLQQVMLGQLAEHAQRVEELLARQSRLLERIEGLVLTLPTDEQTDQLLRALADDDQQGGQASSEDVGDVRARRVRRRAAG